MNSKFDETALTDLDTLFAQVRESQPVFEDAHFTARVVESVQQTREPSPILAAPSDDNLGVSTENGLMRLLSIDAFAGALGIAAVAWLIDADQVLAKIINLIPESIVISPFSVVMVVASISLFSFASWWAVEQK